MNATILGRSAVLALLCGVMGVMTVGLNACMEDRAIIGDPPPGTGGSGGTAGSGDAVGTGTGIGGGRNTDVDAGPPPGLDGGVETPAPMGCPTDVKDPLVLYMSADDSNSMGSPALAREYIYNGFEPSTRKIRTYEFLNYYNVGYKSNSSDDLTIIPEMERADSMVLDAEFQIGIRSFDVQEARRNMVFTFVVDTSGSMKGEGLKRAKAAVHALRSQFVQGDIVNFLTTDGSAPLLEKTQLTGKDDAALINVVDNLKTGGDTDLYKALTTAYALAKKHYQPARMNRVILISDGGTNLGTTDYELIAKESADADKEGIYLVGIGTGPALSYNDELMNAITDAGRGAYVYLDNEAEAQNVLATRFDETMDIAARAVQVELTLPWYFAADSRSTENPLSTKKVEAQHLAPSDAMVFLLNVTTCAPSIYDRDEEVRIRVFWKTRDKFDSLMTEKKIPVNKLFSDLKSPTMAKGRAIVAFAEALKGCGVDDNGHPICKDEAERKQVVKKNLLHARELAVLAKDADSPAEMEQIISLIDQHPLIKP